MNNCKNCGEPINGNYCSNCGHPAKLKRIDSRYIIQEVGDFLFANKGMIYTIKKVLTSPGKSVRQFLTEDRYRFVKPITFLFITSLIYALAVYLSRIGIEDYYLQQLPEGIEFPTFNLIMSWIINYPGYSSILSGLFVAFLIKLFFRKSGYNLFEIFILMCFVSGISALFGVVVLIFQGLTGSNLIHISSVISIVYYAWAIGQFFDRQKAVSYIKAFTACVLGYFLFGFLVIFVAIFIDMVIK